MIDGDLIEFGAPPDEAPTGGGLPFPRMRPNAKLAAAWSAELAKVNEKTRRSYKFPSPLDVVPALIEQRTMPAMPWPVAWVELSRRARTYPGDCVGVVGSIGGGKTSFAIQCAVAATGSGLPCLWANLELTQTAVTTRIAANMHGVHVSEVRERWPRDRIDHTLTAVTDLWRFVDRYDDIDAQMAAIEDAIALAWKIYRVPPVVFVDHLGELVGGERDEVQAVRALARRFEKLGERTLAYIMLLMQSSVSNQAVLTGRTDIDAASDAMNVATGGKAIASSVANLIGLAVFKADDTKCLDARALIIKARNTGEEGQVGMDFTKAGGVWREKGHLPPTPSKVRADHEKAAKDKHRVGPAPTPAQVRDDINASLAGDAAAMRRAKIYEALVRHGQLGMEFIEIRKILGAGRGALLHQALQELQHAGSAERITPTRWRAITRIE